MRTGRASNGVVGLVGGEMVGGLVGVRDRALVGFAVGMDVGTLGVNACWDLLHVCCVSGRNQGGLYGTSRAKNLWSYS